MTTSPLPDLFPHLVPEGADIPDGVRTCRRHGCADNRDDAVIESTGYRGSPIWTETPIPAPRQDPPTEPDTVLIGVTDIDGAAYDRGYYEPSGCDDLCPWRLVAFRSAASDWRASEDLVSWTVADVIPRTAAAPDPLDENDHSDRIRYDAPLTRRECGRWHIGTSRGKGKCADPFFCGEHYALAGWAQDGLVTFADQVTA